MVAAGIPILAGGFFLSWKVAKKWRPVEKLAKDLDKWCISQL